MRRLVFMVLCSGLQSDMMTSRTLRVEARKNAPGLEGRGWQGAGLALLPLGIFDFSIQR